MKKKKIKIFIAIGVIIIVISFMLLYRKTPSYITGRYLKAVESNDNTALKKMKAENPIPITENKIEEYLPFEEKEKKEVIKIMDKKIRDFDYDIKKADIGEKTANVTIEIKTYELGKAYKKWYIESNEIKASEAKLKTNKKLNKVQRISEEKPL